MKNNKTIIIIGAVALAGIGIYLWNRSRKGIKKRNMESSDSSLQEISDEREGTTKPVKRPVGKLELNKISPIKTIPTSIQNAQADKPNTYPMGYISFHPSGIHAVHLNNRPPQGTIRKDDKVNITGTTFDGQYKVDRVWIDSSNRVGAIYLKINYIPTGREDRTFERIGLIERIV
jgi:hypothetical protein